MTTQIEPELPELPEPFDRLVGHYAEGAEVFTADQMRAYALSAIAADRNKRDGCDQCGSKRAVGNPLYCNACHAAFSTHPADAKASVSAGLTDEEIDQALVAALINPQMLTEKQRRDWLKGPYIHALEARNVFRSLIASRLQRLPEGYVAVPKEPTSLPEW